MNSKANQIVLGIIILLVGLFFLAQKSLIHFTSFLFIFVGVAFILLFLTKRKSWALVLGVYITWFSFIDLITRFIDYHVTSSFLFASFFIATAMIFLVLYYTRNKTGLLIPASILFWFGIFTIITGISVLPMANMPMLTFIICLAMAFFSAYFFGRGVVGRWALYTGMFLGAIGLVTTVGFGGFLSGIQTLVALALIIGSLLFIARAIRRK